MLLYLTNIGDILAKAFRYLYSRACSCMAQNGDSNQDPRRRRYLPENYRVQHVVGNSSAATGRFGLEVDDKFHLSVPPPPPRHCHISWMMRCESSRYRMQICTARTSTTARRGCLVPITLCMVILLGYISGGRCSSPSGKDGASWTDPTFLFRYA
ncbi:uncharacterized protein CEXT_357241 [Caerostris extrusa]|uniref:Uncharacterized protein n=1 Tax=Caerostris extrusa TaxID=172846 RepID=A0AAV4SSI1_CAEEX|nr:uncharacterized protein CEXT_357241 [Caerostris extrusa]